MKILEIIPSLTNAGAERFVIDLSNELQKQGNNVTLLTLYNIKPDNFLKNELINVNTIQLGKKPGFDYRIFLKLFKIIKTGKWDVVHSHLRVLNYLIPSVIFYKKAKYFHTIHSDAFKETPNKVLRTVRKVIFKSGRVKPVTISDESDESFTNAYKLKATKIYNGTRKIKPTDKINNAELEIKSLKNNSKTKVFINIARIDKAKNQKLLLDVFAKLKHKNVCLLIIGENRQTASGNQNQIYNELIKNKPDNVYLLGHKDNATDYLFFADAFCLSSLWEGMPISLIEAFSVGCIPVCTPAGGVKDMIADNVNGFITHDFEEKSYFNKITEFLNTNTKSLELIKQTVIKEYKNKYSMHVCGTKYYHYFINIIGS